MKPLLSLLFAVLLPYPLSAEWSIGIGGARQDLSFDGGGIDSVTTGEVLITGVTSVGYATGPWSFRFDWENGAVENGGGFFGDPIDLERNRVELSGRYRLSDFASVIGGVRRDDVELSEHFLDPLVVLDWESTLAEAGIRLQSRPRAAVFHFEALGGAGPADVTTTVIEESSSALLLQGEGGVTWSPGNWRLTPGVRYERYSAEDVEVGATSIFFEARYRFGR